MIKFNLPIYLLYIFFFYISNCSFAQSTIIFSETTLNFGKIAASINPPVSIQFKNNSAEKLAILLIEKGSNVKVKFERRFYASGEKGTMTVYYEPRNTGIIDENIKIYSNLEDEPVILHLTGNVVSVLECFPDPDNMLKRTIIVIDSITGLPVPDAQLELVHNHNIQNILRTKVNKEGKVTQELPIGLYSIKGIANNYRELKTELFIPKTKPQIILEMSPLRALPVNYIASPEIENKPLLNTELPEDKYAANNLILLLDVSSSMKSNNKFKLLQQAVSNLVMILRPFDYVSIITYSSEPATLIHSVPGNEKDKIIVAVEELIPYGITKGVKGLNAAYSMAKSNFIPGGNNRIILATDGEFSETNVPDSFYEDMITQYAAQQIYLSVFGFGVNEEAIDRMKKMTAAGQGIFIPVKSEEQARDFLIEEVKRSSLIEKK